VTPTKRRLVFAGAAALALVASVAGGLAVPSVQDALFTRLVEHHLREGNKALLADDALKVLLCGSSAPFADVHRAQSCVAILAGGVYYLVDAGPGSSRNLQLWQLRGRELAGVFLTHFHSDHLGDLGEVNTNAWLAGHPGPLSVFGGPGVVQVVQGFNAVYALDEAYRTANSGAALLPPAAAVMQPVRVDLVGPPTPEGGRRSAPLHFGEMSVTALEVNHDPAAPAYGYRFDYRGRSVVVSGDTRYHPALASAAEGADVLVHEAQSQHLVALLQEAAQETGDARLAQTMGDIEHYHTDPLEAARLAERAHVRLLVFTHLNPPVSNLLLSRMFYRGVNDIRPHGWVSGEDGTLVTLPVGSSAVDVSTLAR
jgi:ribonuclease Z